MPDESRLPEVIADLLVQLDGKYRTLLMIYGPGDAHLAVGGDATTGVVVYATFDNLVFYQLVAPSDSSTDSVELVAGGQPGMYARRYVVPIEAAAGAAEAFALRGELTADWDWEAG